MSKSKMGFDRWTSKNPTTWPFQVYTKFSRELSHMFIAHVASEKYVYHSLGKVAKWEDSFVQHFTLTDKIYQNTFKNLKQWSESFYDFDNWINLNCIMAISSNLETYLAKTIHLALESDIGTLYGVSKRIDGVEILKHSAFNNFNFEDKVISCTKGEWGSRINSFNKLFGSAPAILTDNISSLERLRKLRNNVGHAFGREIEETRKHDVISAPKISKLTRDKTIYYMKLIHAISKELDKQLLVNHIGEYQIIYFYHSLKDSLSKGDPIPERERGNHIAVLKKQIGRFGASSVGKNFCKELIEYYDAL
jgi:hypothetical protein